MRIYSKQLDFRLGLGVEKRAQGVYTLVYEDASDENNNAENSSAKSILAFETSSDVCSVALQVEERLYQKDAVLPQQHASLLLNWSSQLLAEAKLSPSEIQVIAYSCGPGSFTGVRVSAAMGLGLAFPGKRVIAVPSLQVIAQGIYRNFAVTRVMVIIDARMGQVYCGYYAMEASEGVMVKQREDQLLEIKEIDFKQIENKQWCLITNILKACQSNESFDVGIFRDVITNSYPSAYDVLVIANKMLKRGDPFDLEQSLPIYMHENLWKKKSE
jgi:tRNA threonylcarbamoyladenosine biosynthesis protein TsaB